MNDIIKRHSDKKQSSDQIKADMEVELEQLLQSD